MSLENTHDIGKVKIVMVGAGGGASSLSDLSDTNIVNPLNGQLLGYNSLTGKWGNVNGGGGGGDSYAGLGIGKKKTVTSGVIDTDIELHRAPIVGDRLLVWFDAGVDSPTGIITYNNGTAVTSNVESVSLLSYKNGWNIFEFKNDGLLYVNCWVRVQNVPIPNNTLSGLSDTQISTTPTDGQVLTFDGVNNKWKNKALPTVAANTGTANAELKKLKIGNVVYNADSVKHYDVSAISNGAISVSVPNAGHLDGEIIAVNTGAYTGTTSSAWTLSLSDGQTIEALTMSKADGTAFTDAITANCLLFVKCDIGNSTAVVLGIAGAGTTVQANPTGTPTAYLDKLKVGNGVYDTSAIKPCNVSSITSSTTGIINIPVVDTNIVGKIIAVSTGAYSGTTTNAWALSLTSGGSQVPIAMSKADGTAFTDELTANELLLVYVDTTIDHEQAIVLDIPVNTTEIKTATGNPITLTDAIAGNALEASAEIVATQDLHGYDKPWAGGAGLNKCNPDAVALVTSDTGGIQRNGLEFNTAGTYTLSAGVNLASGELDIRKYSNGTYTWVGTLVTTSAHNTFTNTIADGEKLILFGPLGMDEDAVKSALINAKVMVEIGSTAHTYEPYSNICPITGFSTVTITNVDSESHTATVTVSLGSTVYGGTLDVTSGELTVTHANIASYNGETIGEPWISSMDEYSEGGTPTTGAQVVYTLATPTTTTLTAAQLALVKGYNQLSCNSGDMEITYKASGLDALKERVDELEDAVEDLETDLASKTDTSVVGTVENGTTASQAYAVGEHFIRNDKFCTCISAIASGATLTLNTNYVEGTIAEAIYKLTSYLEQTVTLSTSTDTTVTFSDASITANSLIDLAVSEWGLIPSNVVVASGTCTVTMPQVDSAHSVTVRIYVR